MDKDEESDGNDWDRSLETDMMETEGSCNATLKSQRVVLHFDLDCFYAQVEMIRNPALRTKPLGIQQKNIIVTCNYVARDQGVNKLMSVSDALEKCPQLVLVKGEDLTHYREMSYKVTELLMSHCPLVERLGFDENYMDVTEMVERRLKETIQEISDLSFRGHVYGYDCVAVDRENVRLAIGSVMAEEMRQAIYTTLGLTGCAGVACNKLLAKLVSGSFKPNQQTTLLPQSTAELMGSLTGLSKVPGIGYKTREKLKVLGLVSVRDLQSFPLPDLVKEFGEGMAQRIQNLVCGVDESPVTPAGPPQSLSDEDSFKKISTPEEVLRKIEELLINLTERMNKDGRQPNTLRLTVRRYTSTNRWFNRESRQCPIPNHTGLKITSGSSDAVPQLLALSMKLFHKMIDAHQPFHLTLLNVCFSNLQAKSSGKSSITSFFSQKSLSASQEVDSDLHDLPTKTLLSKADVLHKIWTPINHKSQPPKSVKSLITPKSSALPNAPVPVYSEETNTDIKEPSLMSRVCFSLPADVDPEVFRLLPDHIQRELMLSFTNKGSGEVNNRPTEYLYPAEHSLSDFKQPRTTGTCESAASYNQSSASNDSELCKDHSITHLNPELITPTENPDFQQANQALHSDAPANVDPYVFSQLPADVQSELLTEWRQQRPVLKIPSKHSSKTSNGRNKKATPKNSQCNNILKYFKHA